jgi:hypothetical protein
MRHGTQPLIPMTQAGRLAYRWIPEGRYWAELCVPFEQRELPPGYRWAWRDQPVWCLHCERDLTEAEYRETQQAGRPLLCSFECERGEALWVMAALADQEFGGTMRGDQ